MAIGEGNNEARIEAAGKILSGEVSDEVVNMIAERTDPVAVARTLAGSPEAADADARNRDLKG